MATLYCLRCETRLAPPSGAEGSSVVCRRCGTAHELKVDENGESYLDTDEPVMEFNLEDSFDGTISELYSVPRPAAGGRMDQSRKRARGTDPAARRTTQVIPILDRSDLGIPMPSAVRPRAALLAAAASAGTLITATVALLGVEAPFASLAVAIPIAGTIALALIPAALLGWSATRLMSWIAVIAALVAQVSAFADSAEPVTTMTTLGMLLLALTAALFLGGRLVTDWLDELAFNRRAR